MDDQAIEELQKATKINVREVQRPGHPVSSSPSRLAALHSPLVRSSPPPPPQARGPADPVTLRARCWGSTMPQAIVMVPSLPGRYARGRD